MVAAVPNMDGGLIALTRFSGEIGFYPNEYLEIVRLYLDGGGGKRKDQNGLTCKPQHQ